MSIKFIAVVVLVAIGLGQTSDELMAESAGVRRPAAGVPEDKCQPQESRLEALREKLAAAKSSLAAVEQQSSGEDHVRSMERREIRFERELQIMDQRITALEGEIAGLRASRAVCADKGKAKGCDAVSRKLERREDNLARLMSQREIYLSRSDDAKKVGASKRQKIQGAREKKIGAQQEKVKSLEMQLRGAEVAYDHCRGGGGAGKRSGDRAAPKD